MFVKKSINPHVSHIGFRNKETVTIMLEKSGLCKYTEYNEFNFKEKKHLDAL